MNEQQAPVLASVRNKCPRWNPPTLTELLPAQVQAFFDDFERASGKPVRTA